jgi:hypothetical protein
MTTRILPLVPFTLRLCVFAGEIPSSVAVFLCLVFALNF